MLAQDFSDEIRDEVVHRMEKFRQILLNLDGEFSILRKPWGVPDYIELQSFLDEAKKVGLDELQLSYTPK